VIEAEARQLQAGDTVSTGPIEWGEDGGDRILLRVTASYHGRTRTLESEFAPDKPSDSYYKRAVTVADSMYVNPDSGSPTTDRRETVVINGGIRLGALDTPSDTAWVDYLLEYNPSVIQNQPLPAPNVRQFFTEHPFFLLPFLVPSGGSVTYDMSIGANAVGFYSWLNAPGDFSLWETRTTTLSVNGNVVWMFRDGVRFDKRVRVVSPNVPGSSLVIVGGRNGTLTSGGETYYEAGVWFFGGVESEIPIILVSDGGVYVEQFQDTHQLTQALPQVSIYAGFAFITGPETTSGARLRMDYDKPRMDTLIDWLSLQGALPNASSNSGAQFTLIPGSWREIASN